MEDRGRKGEGCKQKLTWNRGRLTWPTSISPTPAPSWELVTSTPAGSTHFSTETLEDLGNYKGILKCRTISYIHSNHDRHNSFIKVYHTIPQTPTIATVPTTPTDALHPRAQENTPRPSAPSGPQSTASAFHRSPAGFSRFRPPAQPSPSLSASPAPDPWSR